jgi:hypothetical protein
MGGPTILRKSNDEIGFVINEAVVGLTVKFICENPRSHSLDEIGIILRALFKCFTISGTIFSIKHSRNPRIVFLSFN